MNRILVIRGGAIGDFILTLPAIKLLRDRFPQSHLEILGYPHIAVLAERRFYADATRSIESASLARFFAKGAELPTEFVEYFHGFDLIVSYLFDPDQIFGANLRRCGTFEFICGPSKLSEETHAGYQLAQPLAKIGLYPRAAAAHLYLTEADRGAARVFLGDHARPLIALHPGSGSPRKNWPIKRWRDLGSWILDEITGSSLLVVGGEADRRQAKELRQSWDISRVQFAVDQPLPLLAALLADCAMFLGHDSGVSHIAAAVGTRSILLFGPTVPAVWAPTNPNVEVLRSSDGALTSITVDEVKRAIRGALELSS